VDRGRGGQVGCFLSHYSVWTKIALGANNCAAIFEDDVHVAKLMKDLLANDSWLPQDFDIVRLETSTNRLLLDKRHRSVVSDRFLYRLRSTSWCAGAYILSCSCARRLISIPMTCHDKTDFLLFSHEHSPIAKELVVYQFSPALAVQDKFLKDSGELRGLDSNIEGTLTSVERFGAYIRSITPHEIYNSLYKTLNNYKRVPFLP